MDNLFLILGIILIVATLLSLLSRLFKQPLIIAYIIAGLALGSLFLDIIPASATLTTFAQIGVAFLLFIVGINLNLKVIKEIGFLALTLGLAQVFLTTLLGFILTRAFGFPTLSALYISLGLAFSSTIIVVKLLADKNDLETFPGRITLGVLLVQDLIALLTLIFITGLQTGTLYSNIPLTILKGAFLFVIVYVASKFILPSLFNFVAYAQEQLFITSIAWCFLLATIANLLGFTIEIGAFLAGLSLATLPYHHEITSKVAQLRDFFLIIFFVNLGLQISLADVQRFFWPALALSLFVLVGKPLILMLLLRTFGYQKHTNFLVGASLGQISEFSLILATLGMTVQHLAPDTVSFVTLLGIITIPLSSYLLTYNDALYKKLAPYLRFLEKKQHQEEQAISHATYDTLLFGCYRLGSYILDYFQKTRHQCLVIDFNPDVIRKLEKKKIPCMYGDASDHDILNQLNLSKVRLVISTIPKLEDTKALLHYLAKKNLKTITIVTASHPHDAVELYHAGAHYVITPHLLSSELITHTLKNVLEGKRALKPFRIRHLKHLTRFTSY